MSDLPAKCFISHSYRDKSNKHLLIGSLPDNVEPLVFPAITVLPDQMVSNDLIRSILECSGLIYIHSDLSDKSFWVAFERDFAKRSSLPVFAFEPENLSINADNSPPLDLKTVPSYSIRDSCQVSQILKVMKKERHFDLLQSDDVPPCAEPTQSIADQMNQDRIIPVWLGKHQELPSDLSIQNRDWLVLYRSDNPEELDWNEVDSLIVELYWKIYQNTRNEGQYDA